MCRGLAVTCFLEGRRSEGLSTVITMESYLDVRIPLCQDIECPTIDCLNLERAPSGNKQTEEACSTRFISGHTIPTGSSLSSSQKRDYGAGHPARNSGTTVYRDYGGARSPGATEHSFSSWHALHLWWHHGGGFGVYRDQVFGVTHDCDGAANCYLYRYTVDAGKMP